MRPPELDQYCKNDFPQEYKLTDTEVGPDILTLLNMHSLLHHCLNIKINMLNSL